MSISQVLITKGYEWGKGVGREAQRSKFKQTLTEISHLYDFPVQKSGGWKQKREDRKRSSPPVDCLKLVHFLPQCGKKSECKVFTAFIQVLSGFKDWQVLTIFLLSRLLFRQVFSSSCFMSFGERFWPEMFRRKSVCSLWRLLIPGKTSGKLHLTKISQKMFARI